MERIRTADWKTEKHVPVIELLEVKDGRITAEVVVGKGIPHPNTAEHHIKWVELYHLPEKGEFLYPVGKAEFGAHGETGTITEPRATFRFRVKSGGKLVALSLCNIHGLWKSETKLPERLPRPPPKKQF